MEDREPRAMSSGNIWTRLRISDLIVLRKLGNDWKVVSGRGALFSESHHLEEKERLVWLCGASVTPSGFGTRPSCRSVLSPVQVISLKGVWVQLTGLGQSSVRDSEVSIQQNLLSPSCG